MMTTDLGYEGLEASGAGANLMGALAPLAKLSAVRRAHATIRKQLRVHAADPDNPLELGTVALTADGIDLNGVMFEGLFSRMKQCLKAYKGESIMLRVHSGGGSAFEGSALYNLLRQDGRQITTVSMGIAASAASLVFLAGDKRVVAPGAMVMIHDVWTCALGNAAELRAAAESIETASDAIAEIYAERAGGSVEDWRARMATDCFLDGDDAVACGLATSRQTPIATKPTAKAKADAKTAEGMDAKAAEPAEPAEPKAAAPSYLVAWDGSLVRAP